MSDITKCANFDCELRKSCWRHMAPDHEYRQAYGYFEPVNGKCEYRLPYEEKQDKEAGKG